jgi:pilus assembly protein CpaF
VDESSPLVDARLEDGSRVNIVIPPIALDGVSISIRKFKEQKLGLRELVGFGAMSPAMARVLMIAARCRLNIIISGGTGSGKTTLLNALSQYIGDGERILTIEDAAELRIQQPHVVRLETRPPSVEGTGAITQRDLVINALRMRPERIILGECRGSEAFEMLQAMNTGHDGSMSTLHANTPRDAMSRIESMVMMANLSLPLSAIRRTIVSAVNLIIQVNRLRDGSRKITSISEIYGLEGDAPVMEELFRFVPDEHQGTGNIEGRFVTSGLTNRSKITEQASFFGLSDELAAAYEMEES